LKKRAYISYFLLAVFALIYTHQLIPHHEHHHELEEKVSCSHHQAVVCHTEETANFSHLLNHLFEGDFYVEFSCIDVFYKNLKINKTFKTLYTQTIIYISSQRELISKSTDYLNFISVDNFLLNTFSHRGPPQAV
tara:strand:- start:441 stop:845 length:405 start_codon:yes stop_codon:yes gene_type:complete